MNRKQRIIVSVTGIFLVLLILVGLTYAYFLTKIKGNENNKSIEVTTANLILEYSEDTNVIKGIENAEPGYSVEKTFSATNKGNKKVDYSAVLQNVVNELSRKDDLVYTLTCKQYKTGETTETGTCNGVSTETTFPSTSDVSLLISNSIDINMTQTYSLTVTYKNLDVDQSEDMGKTFSAKVNIVNSDGLNPYSSNKNSLAYHIINNAQNNTNGTKFLSTPKSKPITEASTGDEKELSFAVDDFGISYYYRGAVTDNYVDFAGMCWRIVRIQGNGSIKLVLEDQNNTCKTSNIGDYSTQDGNKYKLYAWSDKEHDYEYLDGYLKDAFYKFQTEKISSALQEKYLTNDSWCLNDQKEEVAEFYNYYESGVMYDGDIIISKEGCPSGNKTCRVAGHNFYKQSDTFKCLGTLAPKFKNGETMNVATLTANEVWYSGMNSSNNNSYLNNGSNKDYWTLTKNTTLYGGATLAETASVSDPNSYYTSYAVISNKVSSHYVPTSYGENISGLLYARPSIIIKNNVEIASGNGLKTNAYVFK